MLRRRIGRLLGVGRGGRLRGSEILGASEEVEGILDGRTNRSWFSWRLVYLYHEKLNNCIYTTEKRNL
jgi:hypothetical protein